MFSSLQGFTASPPSLAPADGSLPSFRSIEGAEQNLRQIASRVEAALPAVPDSRGGSLGGAQDPEISAVQLMKRREASVRLGDADSLTWATRTPKRPAVLAASWGGGLMQQRAWGNGDEAGARDQFVGGAAVNGAMSTGSGA